MLGKRPPPAGVSTLTVLAGRVWFGADNGTTPPVLEFRVCLTVAKTSILTRIQTNLLILGASQMTLPKLLGLALVTPFLLSVPALAQRDPDPAAGCAACGTCGAFVIFLIVAVIALNIALLVWVARDAKARGMDSAVVWMVLVMFTGIIGLVIYLFSRPEGNMVRCPSCNNNRLLASAKCPHCGNA